jgi:periplasmic protein TonB
MFADYLSDSSRGIHSRCGWATLASFALQFAATGALLLLPLLSMQGLPPLQLIASLAAPAPPPGPPTVSHAHSQTPASNIAGSHLMTPSQIPDAIAHLNETDLTPPQLPGDGGVQGGTGLPGAANGVFGSVGTAASLPILAPPPALRPPHISHMMEGNLIYRVQPDYPQLARQARIQGTVLLRAVISREGRIENLQVLSGHPMLVQAALAAVRQWRYRPYLLNDQPVEVETQVTVNFSLSGG